MAGQTQSEIRALLTAAGLAPRHRYGQNFLVDLNLMRKVVAAAEVCAADVVLEVGCGTGSLSEMLLDVGARVIGVEIDHGFQALLRDRLGPHPRFTLIQGDALAGKHQINPLALRVLAEQQPDAGGHYKLVANLPYQIATPLLMELLYTTPRFERLTCTIQKEVGERLASEPNTAAYGPVSVITQTLAAIDLVAIFPPTVFWPQPQVESLLLTIRPHPPEQIDVPDIAEFVRFVQRGFQQRRKMLRRIFREWAPLDAAAAFDQAGVSADARAENLAPAQWRGLFLAARSRTER